MRSGMTDARVFRDRKDAGRQLADRLAGAGIRSGVVIGLARGGIEVAAEVAARLGLRLDALAVRKVGHPFQPEYAIGAVTPGGGTYLRADPDALPDSVGTVRRAGAERTRRRSTCACTAPGRVRTSVVAVASLWTTGLPRGRP